MTFQRGQFLHRVAGAAAVPVGTDKRTILRGHYLFGKLTPQHIDRLSACIVTKTVKRGTNIFAKGDPGTSLCAIRGVSASSAQAVAERDFHLFGGVPNPSGRRRLHRLFISFLEPADPLFEPAENGRGPVLPSDRL
jgi:hypothetical protein